MSDRLPDAWIAEDPLPSDPLPILKAWLDEAFGAGLQHNPHAVALATIDPDGRPSARMVLCNHIDTARGTFVMYTNRQSRKGRALASNPRAAIVFHWAPHSRSARVEGTVSFTPDSDCDAYFATRPIDARIGAWASAQSEPIESRAALVARVEETARRFGVRLDDAGEADIPRPPHWGGFTLLAETVELWVSRPARIHESRAVASEFRRSSATDPVAGRTPPAVARTHRGTRAAEAGGPSLTRSHSGHSTLPGGVAHLSPRAHRAAPALGNWIRFGLERSPLD